MDEWIYRAARVIQKTQFYIVSSQSCKLPDLGFHFLPNPASLPFSPISWSPLFLPPPYFVFSLPFPII